MKIFGIGLSRTGTHSLTAALKILGYQAWHWSYTKEIPLYDERGVLTAVRFDLVEPYDAFLDTPIARTYPMLDQKFPGSKFILTIRELPGWLTSCRVKFAEPSPRASVNYLRRDLYETDVFDEEKFRAGYFRHVESVMSYFKNRPQDLLVLDVCSGEGWEKLCGFLDKKIPGKPFPKLR